MTPDTRVRFLLGQKLLGRPDLAGSSPGLTPSGGLIKHATFKVIEALVALPVATIHTL